MKKRGTKQTTSGNIEKRCPNCGSTEDKHEDNGCSPTSRDYTILCTDCGYQWSPNEG